jgi:uncharacterized protein YbaP (TraB family)
MLMAIEFTGEEDKEMASTVIPASATRWFRLSTIFVLLTFAVACPAQQITEQQAKPHRPLLWKVSSDTATVYLFGSTHVGDAGLYPLPASVESAFAASKVLVVELNPKQADPSKVKELVKEYGMYGAGDALSKHLDKETAEALAAFCAKNGLPRDRLEQLKPWMVATAVADLSVRKAGEDPKLGIDSHFVDESKPPQRIAELETLSFQLSVVASATEEEQQEWLANVIRQFDRTKELRQKMHDAYLSGDPDALLKQLHEQQSGPESLQKKIVDDRNVTMTASLEQYLKGNEPCFVVVGVAHLVGDNGIVKLLQGKGYRVEQVGAGAP